MSCVPTLSVPTTYLNHVELHQVRCYIHYRFVMKKNFGKAAAKAKAAPGAKAAAKAAPRAKAAAKAAAAKRPSEDADEKSGERSDERSDEKSDENSGAKSEEAAAKPPPKKRKKAPEAQKNGLSTKKSKGGAASSKAGPVASDVPEDDIESSVDDVSSHRASEKSDGRAPPPKKRKSEEPSSNPKRKTMKKSKEPLKAGAAASSSKAGGAASSSKAGPIHLVEKELLIVSSMADESVPEAAVDPPPKAQTNGVAGTPRLPASSDSELSPEKKKPRRQSGGRKSPERGSGNKSPSSKRGRSPGGRPKSPSPKRGESGPASGNKSASPGGNKSASPGRRKSPRSGKKSGAKSSSSRRKMKKPAEGGSLEAEEEFALSNLDELLHLTGDSSPSSDGNEAATGERPATHASARVVARPQRASTSKAAPRSPLGPVPAPGTSEKIVHNALTPEPPPPPPKPQPIEVPPHLFIVPKTVPAKAPAPTPLPKPEPGFRISLPPFDPEEFFKTMPDRAALLKKLKILSIDKCRDYSVIDLATAREVIEMAEIRMEFEVAEDDHNPATWLSTITEKGRIFAVGKRNDPRFVDLFELFEKEREKRTSAVLNFVLSGTSSKDERSTKRWKFIEKLLPEARGCAADWSPAHLCIESGGRRGARDEDHRLAMLMGYPQDRKNLQPFPFKRLSDLDTPMCKMHPDEALVETDQGNLWRQWGPHSREGWGRNSDIAVEREGHMLYRLQSQWVCSNENMSDVRSFAPWRGNNFAWSVPLDLILRFGSVHPYLCRVVHTKPEQTPEKPQIHKDYFFHGDLNSFRRWKRVNYVLSGPSSSGGVALAPSSAGAAASSSAAAAPSSLTQEQCASLSSSGPSVVHESRLEKIRCPIQTSAQFGMTQRLDKDTTGMILVATNPEAAGQLLQDRNEKRWTKYVAQWINMLSFYSGSTELV